jgi:CheY-like chemotaxis protein
MTMDTPSPLARVLIIGRDRDLGWLLQAVLSDAGYQASCLFAMDSESIRAATGRLEPDCILLDGSGRLDYGASWEEAAWMHERDRRVPVVMFTTNPGALAEAEAGVTTRSDAAHFAALVPKPFSLEELFDAVAKAVGESAPFDWSELADAGRTQVLVEALQAAGAKEIHRSTLREWVTCRVPSGHLVQLFWWQGAGGYYVGVYDEEASNGPVLQLLGFFTNRAAAIACAIAA